MAMRERCAMVDKDEMSHARERPFLHSPSAPNGCGHHGRREDKGRANEDVVAKLGGQAAAGVEDWIL